MVGKNKLMFNESNESIRSEFTVNLRRYSTGLTDVEYSPTFPNTWKSFQQLTRFDSSRQKRYTVAVGSFPTPSFEQGLSSSSESDEAVFNDEPAPPLAKDGSNSTSKRNRFSSGYILGFFLRKQNLAECRQENVSRKYSQQNAKQYNETAKRTPVVNTCERKKQQRLHKIHSVPNIRAKPSPQTKGNIYRRGARRWRKIYKTNGHSFVARRFSRLAQCECCTDIIWGLGRQGYKCLDCRVIVHKKCHRLLRNNCEQIRSQNAAYSSLPSNSAVGKTGKDSDPGVKRTKSDSPQRHRKALLQNAYNNSFASSQSALETSKSHVNVNDFDFLRVIGRGSYAKVIYVSHKKTGRKYAMKIVKKELVNDDEDIDWVQTEKHVFEQASNHPFLVGLHSCFQTASRLFFVIEFVAGGDLMFHMQNQRRLPEDHARFYSAEIACALNYLHENGIIYRDLKLDNVLLDKDGHVKLTDYGMCKEGLRPGDTTSTFCGTPNYIAPEVLRGEDYGLSVDWWATGVLLFEMLAGRSPFDIVGHADNPDQNTEDYLFQVILEKSIRIPRSLSVKAASILKGFLNKNPEDRLGCHPQTGFADIQSHLFFRAINWKQLEARQVTPPFKPRVEEGQEVDNFDPQFTAEPVILTPDDPKLLETIDQSEFEGFEYVNPLLTSAEEVV
ncbi:protein kinase C iota type-like isoform X1 [Dendronephthya gigantea]|uniref:protein kinase C iota type-like isoform X1 n=1 Tax=Dendronephthya gigantea TaxID=151771 RepID=UPI00106A38DD|nr:protein kinase C iota type-like isoform X1 [Dendronephthya gigantea]